MSTAKDKGSPDPQFDEAILATDQDPTAATLIEQLQAQAMLKRHEPGALGKLFGGQANAATNITGLVALFSLAARIVGEQAVTGAHGEVVIGQEAIQGAIRDARDLGAESGVGGDQLAQLRDASGGQFVSSSLISSSSFSRSAASWTRAEVGRGR
jgi:hypothetical protein